MGGRIVKLNPTDPNWLSQVRGWTCNHFSIHSSEGDLVWLLRELAERVSQLGDVDVLDVVIAHEWEDGVSGLTGTVYLAFNDERHE